MSKRSSEFNSSSNSSIAMEAASWLAQLDGDSMTDADRLALREWAARSPKHLHELNSIGQMWFDIDLLVEEQVSRNDAVPSIIKWFTSSIRLAPKPFYVSILVFSIALVVLLGTLSSDLSNQSLEMAYTVPEGQNKQVTLADGSKIHINTRGIVEVVYSKKQRVVRLTRGEAHFKVAHDSKRPFYVYAAGNVVRAVGTAFFVRLKTNETSVIVTEGKVKLEPLPRDSSMQNAKLAPLHFEPTLIEAGFGVSVKNSEVSAPIVSKIPAGKISNELAWRDGLIVFSGESLEYAVDEISRYTRSKIIISDPELRNLPVGGVFEVGKVDALLGALEASFNVEVNRIGDDLVYLSSAGEKTTLEK